MFKPTYLYIKTHNITGLKYFGKTSGKDPCKYPGSGTYWSNHLKVHGQDISTEILGYYTDEDTCILEAKNFSDINDIVNSKEWANLMPENGINGGFISEEQQRHRSVCAGKASWARVNSDPVLRANFRSSRSKQMKKRHSEGLVKYDNFSGKAHTEETKSKMRDSKLGKGLGKENSQFGTCWIYSEVENKKINKLDLDKYLSSGWTKGRKMNFNK